MVAVVVVLALVVVVEGGLNKKKKKRKKKEVWELAYRGVGNTCHDGGERRQVPELPLPLQPVAHQPNT